MLCRQSRRDFIFTIAKSAFLFSIGALPARAQSSGDASAQPSLPYGKAKQILDRIFEFIDLESEKIDRSKFDVPAKAQAIGPDPDRLFAFVRDEVHFEPYWGVLRGATGTLTGMAGNAFDQSVLLAELLQQHGFNIRFAIGEIGPTQSESLLNSFFDRQPAKPRKISGVALGDLQVMAKLLGITADEAAAIEARASSRTEDLDESLWDDMETQYLNLVDSLRISGQDPPKGGTDETRRYMAHEAREHAWVQFSDTSGNWVDLDPAFGNSRRGVAVTPAIETFEDTLPEPFHHAIDVKVVLRTEAFPPQGQTDADGFTDHILLKSTIRTARFAAEEVHLINQPTIPRSSANDSKGSIESIFENVSEFTPVLIAGDEPNVGKSFNLKGEVYSSGQSPTATAMKGATNILGGLLKKTRRPTKIGIVGLWVDYTITSPMGRRSTPQRQSHRRYIVDSTELVKWSPQGEKAWVRRPRAGWDPVDAKPSFFRVAKISLTTGPSNDSAGLHKLYSALRALRRSFETALATAYEKPVAKARADDASLLSITAMSMLAFEFQRDNATRSLGANRFPGLNWYNNEPGLVLFETSYTKSAAGHFLPNTGYDIIRNGIRSIASMANMAGSSGEFDNFSIQRGVLETVLETRFVKQRETGGSETGPSVEGTPAIFDAARAETIAIAVLKGPEDLARLAKLGVREGAKPFIESDLRSGHVVVIPERNVTLNGRRRIGWWRVNKMTGNTLGRMDTGRGAALTEYQILMRQRRWALGGAPIQIIGGVVANAALAFFYTAVLMGTILWLLEGLLDPSMRKERAIYINTRPRTKG